MFWSPAVGAIFAEVERTNGKVKNIIVILASTLLSCYARVLNLRINRSFEADEIHARSSIASAKVTRPKRYCYIIATCVGVLCVCIYYLWVSVISSNFIYFFIPFKYLAYSLILSSNIQTVCGLLMLRTYLSAV